MTANNKLADALRWIVSVLRKHNTTFQVSGGYAAHIYGAKRPVNDIDIDVPDENMESLLPDIQRYIIFGPAQYKDAKWDLQLITLNYNGQEIDIGGAFGAKIFNNETMCWVAVPAKLEAAQIHMVYGMKIPVVCPQDLITYKKLLSGEHQKVDIIAVQEYVSQNE